LVVLGGASALAQAVQPPVAPVYYYYESSGDLGFHFGGDLGGSVMQDFNSSRFGFPGHFSARPGVRFSVAPGYDFLSTGKLTLGADFETGMSYNDLNSIRDAGVRTPLRGHYYQVPLLGDLVLKFHPNSFVVPYIGVGGGGDWSSARIHPASFIGASSSSDEIDPAVEGIAGVRFRLNSMSELGFGYKYLAAFPGGGNSNTATHAALATFNLRF
jgi:opacity protein-like surface antigen